MNDCYVEEVRLCFTSPATCCYDYADDTCYALVYTKFAPAQFMRNWCKQRPINQRDLDSSFTGEVWIVCNTRIDLLQISFFNVLRFYCWVAF